MCAECERLRAELLAAQDSEASALRHVEVLTTERDILLRNEGIAQETIAALAAELEEGP